MELNPRSLEAAPAVEGDLETLLPLEEEASKSRVPRWRLAAAVAGTCAVGLLGAAAVLPKGAQPYLSKMDAAISYVEGLDVANNLVKDNHLGLPVYKEPSTGAGGSKEWTFSLTEVGKDEYKKITDDLGPRCKSRHHTNHDTVRPCVEWAGKNVQMVVVKGTFEQLEDILKNHMDEDELAEIGLVEQDTKLGFVDPGPELHPDRRLEATSVWGIDRIDQTNLPLNRVYNGEGKGEGAHVYIFDTGVRCTHDDFEGRCIPTLEVVGNGEVACDAGDMTCAADVQGHGSHCAGSAAGTTYGVAPKATIHSVKILSDQGGGSFNWFVEAIDWVVTNHESPAIISASLGGKGHVAFANIAITEAVGKGITVVVAAGNENDDACNYSPAYTPAAITVGSTDSRDQRSSFSNYGNCLDLFAPGSAILSVAHRHDSGSETMSGTSMACPHVAGAAAVFLGLDDSLKPSCTHSSGNCAQHASDLVTPLLDRFHSKDTMDVVHDHKVGSPDELLFVGDGVLRPTTTRPPPPSASDCTNKGWKMLDGDCEVDEDCCLTSPGYPGAYGDNTDCSVVIGSNPGKMSLAGSGFSTEANYDILTMKTSDGKEHKFSGDVGPHDYVPQAGHTMKWHSDESVGGAGFKVCMEIESDPCPANGWKKKEACVDEFTYHGETYDGCATKDHHGGWCVTRVTPAELFYADCDVCSR